MILNKIYKHKVWRDVAVKILSVSDKGVKVMYLLRLPDTKNKYEDMNLVDTIKITNEMDNWEIINAEIVPYWEAVLW